MKSRRDLVVRLAHRSTREGGVNAVHLRGPSTRRSPARLLVEFLHVGDHDVTPPALLDGYLFNFLLLGMRTSDRIIIEGPVSRQALRNAYELQEVWARWRPDRYHVVEITPGAVVDGVAPRSGRAIAAFSGGLDSTATLLRHTVDLPASRSHQIRDAVLVHGFDIDVRRRTEFDGLVVRLTPLLASLGVRLRLVRTTTRLVDSQDWLDTHALQVAAVLHQFSDEFDYGLIAAPYPYETLLPAIGSSPVTDHLCSGAALDIVHDGGALTRVDKAALVSRHPLAEAAVKVCYTGSAKDRNCGHCGKCVLTRLNFLASGVEAPSCFDTPFDVQLVKEVSYVSRLGRDTLAIADERSIRDDRFEALRHRIGEDASDEAGGRPASVPRASGRLWAARLARRLSPLRRGYRFR